MSAQAKNSSTAIAFYLLCCLIAVANLVSITYADAFQVPDFYACAVDGAVTKLDHLVKP